MPSHSASSFHRPSLDRSRYLSRSSSHITLLASLVQKNASGRRTGECSLPSSRMKTVNFLVDASKYSVRGRPVSRLDRAGWLFSLVLSLVVCFSRQFSSCGVVVSPFVFPIAPCLAFSFFAFEVFCQCQLCSCWWPSQRKYVLAILCIFVSYFFFSFHVALFREKKRESKWVFRSCLLSKLKRRTICTLSLLGVEKTCLFVPLYIFTHSITFSGSCSCMFDSEDGRATAGEEEVGIHPVVAEQEDVLLLPLGLFMVNVRLLLLHLGKLPARSQGSCNVTCILQIIVDFPLLKEKIAKPVVLVISFMRLRSTIPVY